MKSGAYDTNDDMTPEQRKKKLKQALRDLFGGLKKSSEGTGIEVRKEGF